MVFLRAIMMYHLFFHRNAFFYIFFHSSKKPWFQNVFLQIFHLQTQSSKRMKFSLNGQISFTMFSTRNRNNLKLKAQKRNLHIRHPANLFCILYISILCQELIFRTKLVRIQNVQQATVYSSNIKNKQIKCHQWSYFNT